MASELQERFTRTVELETRILERLAPQHAPSLPANLMRVGMAIALAHPEWAQAFIADYRRKLSPRELGEFDGLVTDYPRPYPIEVLHAAQ